MIITIARECGSGGHEIGERLAVHYNIPLYDKKRLIEEAKQNGMYEEMEFFFSEKPMNSLLYAIAMGNANEKSNKMVYQMMRKLISEKSFILMGRCGSDIFKEEQGFTSVFLHGEEEDKIVQTMRKQNIERAEAIELMNAVDKKRSTFHNYYTGQVWGDARNYHITLNSSLIGIEETAEMIIKYIQMKK